MKPARWKADVALVMLCAGFPAAAHAAPGKPGDAAGLLAFVVVLLLGVIPSLVALEVLVLAVAPAPVQAARNALTQKRSVCLLAGIGAATFGLVLATLLGKSGAGVLGVLFLAALVLGIVIGMPALGLLVGRSIFGLAGGVPSNLSAAVTGLVVILVASLFPIVGWILFLYLCLMALGASVLAAAGRGRPAAES